MLLFILLGSTPIYSQWQNCIEDGDNYDDYKIIPWDAPGNVSELISLGYLLDENLASNTAQKVLLERRITFDVPYNFASGSIIIFTNDYGKMTILDGIDLNIENTVIRNCDNSSFWNGIEVQGESLLSIHNSVIERALTGINVLGNCNLDLEGNKFKSNFISIQFDYSELSLQTGISNNEFYYPDDVSLILGHHFEESKGIYIKNANSIKITSYNYFEGYKFRVNDNELYPGGSIYCENVNTLFFQNIEFNQCQRGIYKTSDFKTLNILIENAEFNWTGTYFDNITSIEINNANNVNVLNCLLGVRLKINNCDYTTISDETEFNMTDNLISNCSSILLEGNIANQNLIIENSDDVHLTHNYFSGYYSLKCNYNKNLTIDDNNTFKTEARIENCNNVNIRNNSFEVAHGITLSGQIGTRGTIEKNVILCNNVINSNDYYSGILLYSFNGQNFEISDNIISCISTENVFFGISIRGTNNVNINNNEITSDSKNKQNYGIFLDKRSIDNRLTNNTITGNGIASNNQTEDFVAGIYIEHSPFNTIRFNQIDNYYNSSTFVGGNTSTNLGCNYFSNYCSNAIAIGTPYLGSISWIGAQKYKGNRFLDDAFSTGVFEGKARPYEAYLSPFYFHTDQGVIYPDPVDNLKRIVNTTFPVVSDCLISELPDSLSKKYNDLDSVEILVIKGDTIYVPDLGGPMPPGQWWSNEWDTYEDLSENDSIMIENTEAYEFYQTMTDRPLGKLWSIQNFIQTELPLIEENRYNIIQAKISELDNINCDIEYQQNMKTVLRLSLIKLRDKFTEWSSEQKDQLTAIAEQCYKYGGLGVLKSRAMLGDMTYDVFYDQDRCNEMESRESKNNFSTEFNIFPNPNQGIFTVQLPNEMKEISVLISDITGKIVFAVTKFNISELKLNLSTLNNGIYIIQLKDHDKLLNRQKIIINKN